MINDGCDGLQINELNSVGLDDASITRVEADHQGNCGGEDEGIRTT